MLKENVMPTGQENRTESRNATRFAAAIMFLVLAGAGYAVATQVDSTADPSSLAVATTAAQDPAPTVYFPAQYVNQAKSVEEHIQAY
jgi:hypothetical protein